MSFAKQQSSDEELVAKFLRDGDEAVFSELLLRHQHSIRSIVTVTLGIHFRSEVDDACQEIHLRMYERAKTYAGNSKFSTWLYRLVKNAAIDYQRKHSRHLAIQVYEDEELIDWQQPAELNDAVNRAINEFVEQLPIQYRSVIYMHYWQGKTTQEIAEHLLISQGTIKAYLHRIRKQIAVIITDA